MFPQSRRKLSAMIEDSHFRPCVMTTVIGCLYFSPPPQQPTFPSSLDALYVLCRAMSQSIKHVIWPAALQTLVFRHGFNQPLDVAGRRPDALECLEFCYQLNQPLNGNGTVLPSNLLVLKLGSCFDQPIKDVLWPSSLRELHFGGRFNQSLRGAVWPDSLQVSHKKNASGV